MMSSGRMFRTAAGQTIAGLRADRGWSLRTLSEQSQISTPYLSEIERGIKEASGATLEQLSTAFDLTLPDLLRAIATTAEGDALSQVPRYLTDRNALEQLHPDDVGELLRYADYLAWKRNNAARITS